jgi:hypothetical protein
MRRFDRVVRLVLVLWIGVVASSAAQELRSQLTGTAADSSGVPLSGATVTVSGSGLVRPRTVTTTEDGRYRVLGLAPGEYSVSFIAAGFQGVVRPGIRLPLHTTLKLDVRLERSALGDVISVPGSPIIDAVTTSIGTSFDNEMLAAIPTARDQWSVLALTPGIQMRAFDVGGSRTGIELPFAAYGVDRSHRTLVEGLIVNNSRTANNGFFDYGSFEEMRVSGAGGSIEAPAAGALLNFAVKSGGDAFHGELWGDFYNGALVAENRPDSGDGQDGFFNDGRLLNDVDQRYDVNGNAGGRIVRQRLWFFTSARQTEIGRRVPGVDFDNISRQRNLTGKVDYAIGEGHQLIAFYNWRSKTEPTSGISFDRPLESTANQIGRMQLGKLQWTSVLSRRAFLDLQGGLHASRTTRAAHGHDDESLDGVPAGRQDDFGRLTGGATDYHRIDESRPQVSGGLTVWHSGWGDHSLELGFQAFQYRDQTRRFVAGDVFYHDDFFATALVDIFNTPHTASNEEVGLAVHAQDAWTFGRRFTLTAGVRADRYQLGWPDQRATPNQAAFFPVVTVARTTLVKRTGVAPTLGVAWDVAGDSRTVVKVFGGRSYLDPTTSVIARANPIGTVLQRYQFFDANRNRQRDPDEPLRLALVMGTPGTVRVDPGIRLPYADEVSAHVERQIGAAASLRVSYVLKQLRDQDAEVDIGRVNSYTIPFANNNGPLFHRVTNDFDVVHTTPGAAVGTPPFDADHQTLELAYHRRFAGRWLLLASWDGTWNRSFVAEAASPAPELMSFLPAAFRWNPNQRRFGRVNTSAWNANLVGRYEWPAIGFAVAPVYRLHSGYNWAAALAVPIAVADNGLVPAEEPGNRAPLVSVLDVRAEKTFTFGQHELSAIADVFNATNAGTALNFTTIAGSSSFRSVSGRVGGRTIRFAGRYVF